MDKTTADLGPDARVEWMYPNIYTREGQLSRLRVSLNHVRAADELIIEYDGARDGYVIRMDRTRDNEAGNGCDVVEEAVEVAFVPAWLEVAIEPLPPLSTPRPLPCLCPHIGSCPHA